MSQQFPKYVKDLPVVERQNVQVEITTTRDDHFYRTGLVMERVGGNSFDLVDPNHQVIARINVHNYINEAGDNWSIDICSNIGSRTDQSIQVLSWKEGARRELEDPGPISCTILTSSLPKTTD